MIVLRIFLWAVALLATLSWAIWFHASLSKKFETDVRIASLFAGVIAMFVASFAWLGIALLTWGIR